MRLTVITSKSGKIIGTVQGHSNDFISGEFRFELIVPENQKLHVIVVPDEFEKMDTKEFHKNVALYLKKSK
jgi:hypothetical protein